MKAPCDAKGDLSKPAISRYAKGVWDPLQTSKKQIQCKLSQHPSCYLASVPGDHRPRSADVIPQTAIPEPQAQGHIFSTALKICPPSPSEPPQILCKTHTAPKPTRHVGGRAGFASDGQSLDIWVSSSSSPRMLIDSGTVGVINPRKTIQAWIFIGKGGNCSAL